MSSVGRMGEVDVATEGLELAMRGVDEARERVVVASVGGRVAIVVEASETGGVVLATGEVLVATTKIRGVVVPVYKTGVVVASAVGGKVEIVVEAVAGVEGMFVGAVVVPVSITRFEELPEDEFVLLPPLEDGICGAGAGVS